MKKVLSIDFDFIMYPCIKLYNDYCMGSENPTVVWDNIERRLEVDKFLSYDADALRNIVKVIKRNVKNGAKFIPIREHQELVPLLPEGETFHVLNIDFHHDICYGRESGNEVQNFDKYNCSNWVAYLHHTKKLESYTWLRAYNSSPFNPDVYDFTFPEDYEFLGTKTMLPKSVIVPSAKKYKELTLRDFDLVESDYDYIYFCLSPQWVPYKFEHLYDLIVDIFKED